MATVNQKVECRNQARFCYELAKRLQQSVQLWYESDEYDCRQGTVSLVNRSSGATKHQIKEEIIRLRRELSVLFKELK